MKRTYPTFSESAHEVLDFARCQRADGTFYGTSGQCRKGKPVGPKEKKALKKAAAAGNKKAKLALDVVEGKKTKAQAVKELGGEAGKKATPTPKPKAKATPKKKAKEENPKKEYAALIKQQQELANKNDIDGLLKLLPKIKAAAEKVDNLPEEKAKKSKMEKEARERAKEEKDFDAAQKRRIDGQLAANLTAKDKKVILDYTQETEGETLRSYANLNGCLRFPPSCEDPKKSKKFAKEFDAALKKLPKNEEGNKFYRGVQVNPGQTQQLYDALKNAKPGTKMRDPGYGSYSAERKVAEDFISRNRPSIIFVTRNKDMTPINVFSAIRSENEAILPRGTEQVIRKVTQEGKNLIVELD